MGISEIERKFEKISLNQLNQPIPPKQQSQNKPAQTITPPAKPVQQLTPKSEKTSVWRQFLMTLIDKNKIVVKNAYK